MSLKNNDAINDPLVNPMIVDCQGDLVDVSMTPQIHPDFLKSIPPLIGGDLVSTSDNKVGLIISPSMKNSQNILFFRVMVEGQEMHYSRLQLKKIDGDNA